jgi:uncharacterized membrane protein YhaH (DUF805 family)
MALVKDSYKYHTRLDSLKYLESGALQHLGENTLAILSHLVSNTSSAELRNIKKAKEYLYFTALGGKLLILVTKGQASLYYLALFTASVALALRRVRRDRIGGYVLAFFSVPVSLVSGIVAADLTAFVMAHILDRPLTYFRKEWWCTVLYGTPTLLGEHFVIRNAIEAAADPERRKAFLPHSIYSLY